MGVGGWDYNRVLHLEPCGFGSLIRLRSQTAPGLQFSRYRRLAGYFNHTPMYQATALRSESRKNTRPHSVRDCRRYSRLICGSTRVRIPPRWAAKKETISDQRTSAGTAVVVLMAKRPVWTVLGSAREVPIREFTTLHGECCSLNVSRMCHNYTLEVLGNAASSQQK